MATKGVIRVRHEAADEEGNEFIVTIEVDVADRATLRFESEAMPEIPAIALAELVSGRCAIALDEENQESPQPGLNRSV